jgi:hypothetical protein
MADVTISVTIPDAKVAIALEGFLKTCPNVEKNPDGNNKYTNVQWVREKMRRLLIDIVIRGLQKIEDENSVIETDDTIVT